MSDKPDPFHLGGGLVSPIWPQLPLLSVARLSSLPSPCLLFRSPRGSFLHPSVDYSPSPPTAPRSGPHWGTDPAFVSSCPVLPWRSSEVQQPPLLSAASHLKPKPSTLAFKLNIQIISGESILQRWGMGGVQESRGLAGDVCKH